jgi:hypothetical protein
MSHATEPPKQEKAIKKTKVLKAKKLYISIYISPFLLSCLAAIATIQTIKAALACFATQPAAAQCSQAKIYTVSPCSSNIKARKEMGMYGA